MKLGHTVLWHQFRRTRPLCVRVRIAHKSSRIDYVFYVPANVPELKAIDDISTGALIGTEASDHNPQVATFAVK
jgi:endonuclease/exonuclease/phosphatase (EEP) superfamily protein YafD